MFVASATIEKRAINSVVADATETFAKFHRALKDTAKFS
jgi:heme oxygenase